VSSMLRLKIIRVRRSVRVKCPRHPRYNPERDVAGAIRGGCLHCVAICELYAGSPGTSKEQRNRRSQFNPANELDVLGNLY
jgi:hypothetical protein